MAAIATQEVFTHTDSQVEVWNLGAATPARTLVVQGDRLGVSLTDTVGVAKPDYVLYGSVKISGVTQAGVGNDLSPAVGQFATAVATDGTWEFEGITGVTATTAQGTVIYLTSAGALTTTAATNTRIGVVNYNSSFVRATGVAPVKIGA